MVDLKPKNLNIRRRKIYKSDVKKIENFSAKTRFNFLKEVRKYNFTAIYWPYVLMLFGPFQPKHDEKTEKPIAYFNDETSNHHNR